MNDGSKVAVAVATALVLAAVAWMAMMRTIDAGPDVDAGATEAAGDLVSGGQGEGSDDDGAHPDEVGQAYGQGDTDEGEAGGDRLMKGGLTPGDRRAKRIEGSVRLVLSTVAPELNLDELETTCTPDGRHCEFWGDWPGDDFLARWIRATSSGQISSEQLRGVTFERFEPVDQEDGQRSFVIEAVLKPASERAIQRR